MFFDLCYDILGNFYFVIVFRKDFTIFIQDKTC
jgi:hypothetical protein